MCAAHVQVDGKSVTNKDPALGIEAADEATRLLKGTSGSCSKLSIKEGKHDEKAPTDRRGTVGAFVSVFGVESL